MKILGSRRADIVYFVGIAVLLVSAWALIEFIIEGAP